MPQWMDETEDEISARMLKNINSKWDKREGGFIYDVVRTVATERAIARRRTKETFYMYFAMMATGDDLDRIVEDRTNGKIKRAEAEGAKGKVEIMGNKGTRIPAGTRYMSIVSDGEQYIEFEQLETVIIPESEEILAEVVALTTGQVGNIPAHTIEIASPVVGIASVTNEEDFSGGRDTETDDSLRQRYIKYVGEEAASGNVAHYVKWSLEVEGVGGVQVIPLWDGEATVKVIVVDTDGRPASPEIVTTLQEKLAQIPREGLGTAPIGAEPTVVSAEEMTLNVTAQIVLTGSRNVSDIELEFKAKLHEYLKKKTLENWQSTAASYLVSTGYVTAILIQIDGVKDVIGVELNDHPKSLEIPAGTIADLGSVTLNE